MRACAVCTIHASCATETHSFQREVQSVLTAGMDCVTHKNTIHGRPCWHVAVIPTDQIITSTAVEEYLSVSAGMTSAISLRTWDPSQVRTIRLTVKIPTATTNGELSLGNATRTERQPATQVRKRLSRSFLGLSSR
jgi:hypothetical protein